MAETEATQGAEALADAPSARTLDLTNLRGFQLMSGVGEASEANPIDDGALKIELAKELAARATRLAEAVDDALTLANDGTIRWLGDPIAKLATGQEALKPRAIILAHEALPEEGRQAVETRVALWLAAHVRKALGPLIDLAEPESVPEGVRDLALKLSQSLGVLERERVKSQVKALDQNARGALRKLGVRFGAFYIYVPALLKPAARTLCTQLWALVRADPDKEAVAERLLHFASSGRTSFAAEPPVSAEVYRVAGFRLCGDRAVRVDIVERLADLIRAALPRPTRSAEQSPAQDGGGFVVTSQMTSLTGCSGEHFASILRSLGFASHKVKKSEFLAAARKAAALAATSAATPAPNGESGPPGAAARTAADAPPGEAAPAPEAAAGQSAPIQAEQASAESAPAPEAAGGQSAPIQAEQASAESAPAPEAAGGQSAPSQAEQASAESAPAPEAASGQSPPIQDEQASAEAASPVGGEAGAPTPSPAAAKTGEAEGAVSGAGEDKPAEDELIEIWRPAPRRPRHGGREHARASRGGEAKPAPPEGGAASQDARPRKPWRDRRHGTPARPAQPEPAPGPAHPDGQDRPAGVERPAPEPAREARRPSWRRDSPKGRQTDDGRGAAAGADKGRARPAPAEQRKPSVNLDSPFAKLLDLKPLLKPRDTTK